MLTFTRCSKQRTDSLPLSFWGGLFLLCLFALSAPRASLAAGFQNNSQSISAMGRALAGSASFASDASSLFYNPALMVTSPYKQLTIGGVVDIYDYELSAHDATGFAGGDIIGGDSDDTTVTFLPSFYYTQPLFDHPKNRVWLGLGVTTPYSLNVEYDDDAANRYQAKESYLYSVDINPSIAVLVTPKLSLGAGFSAQWMDAEFKQNIDAGGGWCYANPELCVGGITPGHPDYDGETTYEADSWGFGWNLGLLWRFSERSFLGIAYRSFINHDLDGSTSVSDLRWVNDPFFYDWLNYYGRNFDGEITTPDTITISLTQFFSHRFVAMLDVQYARWSAMDDANLQYDNGEEKGDINWNDTVRVALGGQFIVDQARRWTLRAGIAYDPSPISSNSRSTAIPDSDSIELAFGIGYRLARTWQIDFAYAHNFYDKVSIDESNDNGSFDGSFKSMRDRVGLQITKAFIPDNNGQRVRR